MTSDVAWRTKKNGQTRPPSSAGSRPPLPKFSGYVEVDAHYIFHRNTIWVRPLCTELGPKNPPKKPILPWSKRIYVACGDIINVSLRIVSLHALAHVSSPSWQPNAHPLWFLPGEGKWSHAPNGGQAQKRIQNLPGGGNRSRRAHGARAYNWGLGGCPVAEHLVVTMGLSSWKFLVLQKRAKSWRI